MSRPAYPPGPRGPFSALSLFAGRNNPAEHLVNLSARFGPVVHLRMAGRHVYFINEPDLVREVLVLRNSSFVKGLGLQRTTEVLGRGLLTSEGELHRRQRQLAQPAFRHDRVDAYAESMVARHDSVTDGWSDGQEIDIAEVTTHLTLDIVARTPSAIPSPRMLLDPQIDDHSRRDVPAPGRASRASIEAPSTSVHVEGGGGDRLAGSRDLPADR